MDARADGSADRARDTTADADASLEVPADLAPPAPDAAPETTADVAQEQAGDLADVASDVGADLPVDGPAGVHTRWKSGSRLRARITKGVGSDAAVLTEIIDTLLGKSCHFADPGDGSRRCLPFASSSSIVYTDAGCTMPVYRIEKGAPPPAFVTSLNGCGGAAKVYAVGTATTPTSTYRRGGTCEPITTGLLSPTYDYYALAVAPLTTFVAATEQREDRGGGLAMRYWKSDDGGLFPMGAWDNARGAACGVGGELFLGRCVPRSALMTLDTFADAVSDGAPNFNCRILAGAPSAPSSEIYTTTSVTYSSLPEVTSVTE